MDISSALVAVRGNANEEDSIKLAGELLNSSKSTMYILYFIAMERGLPLDAEVGLSSARGEQVLKRSEHLAKRFKCKTEANLLQARQAGAIIINMPFSK